LDDVQNWIVYILKCSDNTLYCGITNNLESRLKKHNDGKGARYTRSRLPVSIVKFFTVENRSVASSVEIKVKKLSRKQKMELESIENLLP